MMLQKFAPWFAVMAVVGCADPAPGTDDVVGPFTGTTHRFVVDSITLPMTSESARALGADLDGNRSIDNQLGMVVGLMASFENITTHGDDIIAAGVIDSTVEITADDLSDDATVSVRYLGAASDGDAVPVGGTLVDGVFTSNRTATTRVPGFARLHLPVFVDADPTTLPLAGMQLDLTPDGVGGYDGRVHGIVDDVARISYDGIVQMLANRPRDHYLMLSYMDTDRDRVISFDEYTTNQLVGSILAPDVELFGAQYVSFGFAIHLSPCASGRCAREVVDHCFDRTRDGGESDVDCGGPCEPCGAIGATCTLATDCETAACEAGGTCADPTCSDGILDGTETGIDCGGPCAGCATGGLCYLNSDCASGQCGEPCPPESLLCVPGLDTCR